MKKKYTRRAFLKNAAVTSAGVALGATSLAPKSYSRILGANDRVNFAVVGLHGRGRAHIGSIAVCENTLITHVCDVDRRELEQGAARVKDRFGHTPVKQTDFRKLLESQDIDAIAIATPDHWHAHMSILGLQAGKHVYVEKPCCHNPAEGELLLQAQKKYGKLVQMGNQQRSSAHTMEAIQKIREGMIGEVYFGKAWYSNSRNSIGTGKQVPVPEYLDWELWQGPAPRRPYKDNYHPYNWHWFRHWGTGESLNNGTHEVDICLWALDVRYPNKIAASGGRYHFKDDWEFYDTFVTSFEYEGKMITWEGKSCNDKSYYGRGRGVTIHGTKGTVLIDRNGYEIEVDSAEGQKTIVFEKKARDASTAVTGFGPITDAHFQNFLDAIRKGEKLRSPIDEGNVSVTMLLLSNIAWRVGRTLHVDAKNGHILNDQEAMAQWGREYEPGWELKT